MTDQTVVAPPPGPPPSYEFSKTENATISRASKWAKALAIMFFITTALQVLNLNILAIVVDLAIGITFWKGATLLDAVVQTEDDDVPNMMGALSQLQTAFTIRIIITTIAAAIALLVSVWFFVQYEFMYEPVEDAPAVTVEDEADEAEADEAEADEAEEDEAEAEEPEGADDANQAPVGAAPAADGAGDSAPSDAAAGDAPPAGPEGAVAPADGTPPA